MATLRSIKTAFKSNMQSSFTLVQEINSSVDSGQLRLHPQSISILYEISFIKIFTAWEFFLESAFINYLCGKYTIHYKPKKVIKRITQDNAYNILKGTRQYPDWTNISDVILLSRLFFENGGSFSNTLSSIEVHYNDMKSVRNAITHISKESRERFLSLLRRKLTAYDPNMSPGDFLKSKDSSRNDLFINVYASYLDAASDLIIRT